MGDHDLLVGGAFEWHGPGHEFVADDAQRIEVRAGVLGTLWSQIGGCAHDRARGRDAGKGEPSSNPEVGKLDRAVESDQNVGGLDVAMDDACGIGIG